MLGLHHDAGLFGYEEARLRTDAALERLFASYRPLSIGGGSMNQHQTFRAICAQANS